MTTKKRVVAKTVSSIGKSRPSRAKAKRVLARAEGPQCFWVRDGSVLADLVELEQVLEHMAGDVFSYHVSEGRNDFADWIEFVLGDTELSAMIREVGTPKKARALVVKRLKIYQL